MKRVFVCVFNPDIGWTVEAVDQNAGYNETYSSPEDAWRSIKDRLGRQANSG